MSRAHLVIARLVGAALAAMPVVASAQLPNVSNAATALGGAYTARGSGYNAVYWNPANLGMPGNQGFSFTILGLNGDAGIKPIDFAKLAEYSGDTIPRSVREQWMLDVEKENGQKGGLAGGITGLGFSVGSLGFQFATNVSADMNLAPGAVEALMFGNAGRYDSLRTLSLAGSSLQTAVYSTGALSYGMRLPMIPLSNFAIGATVKYTVGHALVLASDAGSTLGANDVTVNFPAIVPDSVSRETGNVGSGYGVDLGAAWNLPGFRFGVSVKNVVNTFKWDTTKFATRSAVGLFSADTNYFESDTVDKAYGLAPAAIREKVAGLKFKPVIAAGVSFDWLPRITVSADVRQQVGEGIEVGPESMIGAGAELRLIPFIPLRGGIQMMTGGFGVSGGVAIRLLGLETGVGGYVRKRDGGSESGFTLNAFSIRP
jgi:hypothetical protein